MWLSVCISFLTLNVASNGKDESMVLHCKVFNTTTNVWTIGREELLEEPSCNDMLSGGRFLKLADALQIAKQSLLHRYSANQIKLRRADLCRMLMRQYYVIDVEVFANRTEHNESYLEDSEVVLFSGRLAQRSTNNIVETRWPVNTERNEEEKELDDEALVVLNREPLSETSEMVYEASKRYCEVIGRRQIQESKDIPLECLDAIVLAGAELRKEGYTKLEMKNFGAVLRAVNGVWFYEVYVTASGEDTPVNKKQRRKVLVLLDRTVILGEVHPLKNRGGTEGGPRGQPPRE